MSYERELEAVLGWFDATDQIALEHFRAGPRTEIKRDGTPVTAADRSVEQTLRRAIDGSFAGDGILGEELGELDGTARRWIIDPIDGTKNFARGIPVFGTLVALEDQGRLALGAISAPALGSRWWATDGGGAFRDGRTISVSSAASVATAEVTTGSIDYADDGQTAGLLRLVRNARRWRAFGDFWGHMLVAQGSMEVMVEFAPLALWDIAACKIIVEEAGGRATDLLGDTTLRAGPLVTSNGLVHDEALRLVREDR